MFVGKSLTNIRILHGYTRKELAELLNISEQSIWQYENGYMSPKLEVVNQLKSIFNVKSKYFYSKDLLEKHLINDINSTHIAYRATTINSIHKTQCEAKHVDFINSFMSMVENKISYPENEILVLRKKAIEILNVNSESRLEKIKLIAKHTRKFLELNTSGNQNLLFLLEKKGVFIFEKAIGEKIDAYSVWTEEDRPFIILGNLKKSAVRRNFDLAHELGHLLIHYKVEFSSLDKKAHKEFEKEADTFAAELLLPEEEFKKDFLTIHKNSNPDAYIDMKKKWMVSIAAIGYRAQALKLLDYQKYRYFNILIVKKGYKVNEPLDDELKIPRPGKVRSILQLLFENNVINMNELVDALKVDIEFFVKLLGIPTSFFAKYQDNNINQFNVRDLNIKAK
ncbi:helix-turn-helix domain-containing protein [Alkalihalobacillus trypoxylicola]|uniref:Transcriptional regulator n=1 Tax=Alkalihalobacillus trypoxylicola TaxID=519424 RepID=A0A162DMN1_9BACI|nr:XRE family transcriptional regulator [Alkalihalobacillus trypoxylicola]KYG30041.1 transcriptional regulator [Alkalihalobacillus trypoxylicola]